MAPKRAGVPQIYPGTVQMQRAAMTAHAPLTAEEQSRSANDSSRNQNGPAYRSTRIPSNPSVAWERCVMPRRPARITQADVARVIRAAKQTGASEVEVKIGDQSVIVRLDKSTGQNKPLEENERIIL